MLSPSGMPGVQPVAGTCNRSGGTSPRPPVIRALIIITILIFLRNMSKSVEVDCKRFSACDGKTSRFNHQSLMQLILLTAVPSWRVFNIMTDPVLGKMRLTRRKRALSGCANVIAIRGISRARIASKSILAGAQPWTRRWSCDALPAHSLDAIGPH